MVSLFKDYFRAYFFLFFIIVILTIFSPGFREDVNSILPWFDLSIGMLAILLTLVIINRHNITAVEQEFCNTERIISESC